MVGRLRLACTLEKRPTCFWTFLAALFLDSNAASKASRLISGMCKAASMQCKAFCAGDCRPIDNKPQHAARNSFIQSVDQSKETLCQNGQTEGLTSGVHYETAVPASHLEPAALYTEPCYFALLQQFFQPGEVLNLPDELALGGIICRTPKISRTTHLIVLMVTLSCHLYLKPKS